jgi:tight adherence protein C
VRVVMAELLLASAAFVLALALAMVAWGLLHRVRQSDQHEQVINDALARVLRKGPQADEESSAAATFWRRGRRWLELIGTHFEDGHLGKALLAKEDLLLLDQTNHNTTSGRALFLGLRVVLALLFPIVVLVLLRPAGARGFVELLAGLAAGLLLPKFFLSAWAARLRKRVENELPLLIDLLRLLQGIGFSMDQSLQTIAERFRVVIPLLGRELREANISYAHGRPREQSLRRLGESFDNADLKSLVQIILQVHQHGGAVQEPLREFAERLREQRKLRMKEKTGKLSVKMTLVMMLTLLPALMAVLAGPAIVSLIGTMAKLKGH